MRWPATLFVAWIVLGLDAGLRRALAIGHTDITPSLALAFIVYIALNAPTLPALWTAFLMGLITDLAIPQAGPPTIGPATLGFTAAAYFAGTLRGVLMRRSLTAFVLAALFSAALAGIVAVAILTIRSIYPVPEGTPAPAYTPPLTALLHALASALYTAVAAIFLGLILMPLHNLFGFEDTSSPANLPASARRYSGGR